MMLTRRVLLGGAAGVVAAGAVVGIVPGTRDGLRDLFDSTPEPPHPVPQGPTGPLISGSFRSAAMSTVTGFGIAYPERVVADLPFLLVLHGRGDSHRDVFGKHHLGAFLSDAVRRGVPPFAVVGVDGGDHTYWHARATGQNPQGMILGELLPMLKERGLRTDRFALGGWSMGGYGALLLGERLGPTRVAAVVADSPAVWTKYKDAADGAFDSAGDYGVHDVFYYAHQLQGVRVRVTCGTSDPFLPAVRSLLTRIPGAESDLSRGGHDLAFWEHVAPAQLEFAGRALALG